MTDAGHPPREWKGTYFIGRYRVVDEIGVGGMASVYLARADGAGGFQKWVAIKRIHPHLTENEHVVRMFLDEARIAASLSHPNVAQVFDLGQHDGTYWIAMEYLHGEPVREIVRHREQTGSPTEPSIVARIIADAAEGLHAAHELRAKDGRPLHLVHRDVSPHNLFVTYDGVVKVVDFGIAKVAGRPLQTRVGVIRGKLAYMSPEQALCKELDRRTDVFALGVVAWELLTGRRLFRAANDLATVRNVIEGPIPRPRSVHASVPAPLDDIVMRALERDPERRIPTARELSRALQQFLVDQGQVVGPQEISAFLRSIFHERIPMRDAHLEWAAEVTQTIRHDQLDAPSSGPNQPQRTGSVALPLVRRHPDTAAWEQTTIPRDKVDASAASPLPEPLANVAIDDEELRTEVALAWGLERDRVIRPRAGVAARSDSRAQPAPQTTGLPSPLPRPASNAPAQGAPGVDLQREHAFTQAPPTPSSPATCPLPQPDQAGQPDAWARYVVAAALTFVVVAFVSLALVFAFRVRIRQAMGIRPTMNTPTLAPSR